MIPKAGIAHTCHLGDIVGAHMSFTKEVPQNRGTPFLIPVSNIHLTF